MLVVVVVWVGAAMMWTPMIRVVMRMYSNSSGDRTRKGRLIGTISLMTFCLLGVRTGVIVGGDGREIRMRMCTVIVFFFL